MKTCLNQILPSSKREPNKGKLYTESCMFNMEYVARNLIPVSKIKRLRKVGGSKKRLVFSRSMHSR